MDYEESFKDPLLKGIYVKRCKCGKRPYTDRCPASQTTWWIVCDCGRESEPELELSKTIDNWNNDILSF